MLVVTLKYDSDFDKSLLSEKLALKTSTLIFDVEPVSSCKTVIKAIFNLQF
jgi:hypothetical protein